MEIQCVRLTSGEDLIGELAFNLDRTLVTIKNPAQIVLSVQQEKDTPTLSLAPWMVFADKREFPLRMEQIITIFNPAVGVRNAYSQLFGSGIIVPEMNSEKLILG